MHAHPIDDLQHNHVFLGAAHRRHERRTWIVVVLTLVMMVAEIIGGTIFHSMALVADGWHMSTHAAALGIAGFAYLFARRHARDARFTLGTGKFGDLAAFASAILLGMIAVYIGIEAIARLTQPVPIGYREAIVVATLGLVVNLVSAWLLREDHAHGHPHHHAQHDAAKGHSHSHAHDRHHDQNLRAAYVHVLADALTSLLAIAALAMAWTFDWPWADPLAGLAGTAVILSWSVGLIRSAGAVLLDTVPDPRLADSIRQRIETDGDRVCDLHLWRVGPGHTAVILSLVSSDPQPPSAYKERLHDLPGLSHVTVEVQRCEACA